MLVTSFILSRLDYCNSLLAGITSEKLSKLQVIQNSAAKLVTKQKNLAHSKPLLFDLHWLPVKDRINYKIALMCFKCLNDEAPIYLKEFLDVYTPTRALRSGTDRLKLKSSKIANYKAFGERSFLTIGPKTWNALPRNVREASSIETFKSRLKHYYFLETFF